MDSDDDAATDVFLDDWESGTGVVPLFALVWVLDWGGWPVVLLAELGNIVGAKAIAGIT